MERGIVAVLLASTGFAGQPAAGTIAVAVARRPATLVSPEVAARFDLVSFDPRGTNRGNPVTCDATLIHERPNMIPETGARLAVVLAHNKKLGASCRAHTGPLIDYIDNDSVARDIDALRAGIGTVEDSFAEFVNWCAADPACAVHGRDVGRLMDDLYAKAVAGYNWATNVARQIEDSVLLTYDGWGHGVLDRTECTRAAVDNYLLDGTLPGTRCPIGNAMSQISSSGAAEVKSAR